MNTSVSDLDFRLRLIIGGLLLCGFSLTVRKVA